MQRGLRPFSRVAVCVQGKQETSRGEPPTPPHVAEKPLKSGVERRLVEGGPGPRGEPGVQLHTLSRPALRLARWPVAGKQPMDWDPGGGQWPWARRQMCRADPALGHWVAPSLCGPLPLGVPWGCRLPAEGGRGGGPPHRGW